MGEQIQEITGILNGSTNFILTKMDKEGASFDAVPGRRHRSWAMRSVILKQMWKDMIPAVRLQF